MSGGFFRGTSADQDTRFSNKQAKLMKSQKFAPELEHLVDTSKVNMDVVKPWIATRVTQLLGFEDEVLINFIYGLLDGKDVNGKEVQIQITGFMEKNTGKFMKELWGLLLSAQVNASGVPQQFLDEKEEEIRKKKVESDRITGEIQKKKELEQENQKQKLMDAEIQFLKHGDHKASTPQHEDDKGYSERNGFRGKNRNSRSPHPREDAPSSPIRINRSRSMSKSFSNSRSYSDDGHKSRSVSKSPQSRARSISLDRRYRSPRKRSLSPYRKYSPRKPRSPLGRRSPMSRHRSPFRSWRRSPSPRRRRSPSPRRRRSPSPRRRRSPSPRRRRSPSPMLRGSPSLRRRRSPITMRRRSPSPVRRSPSPVRRRSPSPVKRSSPSPVKDISPSPVEDRTPSPVRHRRSSPVRRRSPIAIRRRSRTPTRYRSPYPPRRRSPSPLRRSPLRSPRRRRSPLRSRQRFRSGSPYRITSPPHRRRRSSSSDRDDRINSVVPRKYKEDYVSDRTLGRRSPQVSEREVGRKRLDDASRQPPISLRSPQREPRDRGEADRERPVRFPSRDVSPSQSGSSLQTGKSSPSEDRRESSRSESPANNTKERTVLTDTAAPVKQTSHTVDGRRTIKEEGTHYSRGQRIETPQRRIGDSPRVGGSRNIPGKDSHHEDYFPGKIAGPQLREAQWSKNDKEIKTEDRERKREKASLSADRPLVLETSTRVMEAVEYGPSGVEVKGFSPGNARDEHPSAKQRISPSPRTHKSCRVDDSVVDEEKHPRIVLGEEADLKSTKRIYSIPTNRTAMLDSDSENERSKPKDMERRKHKRRHIDSEEDSSDDSHVDERKEAKRRRKEEKRLRKEEKRRRREERHRKKEERRAGKLKAKAKDMVPPDAEKKYRKDDDDSDDQVAAKIDAHPSDIEEAEFEQKKLEIELREKALESLRAKKAINP